ncbi:MAG: ABC transporter permease subunit [Sporolactobacillus sp.]
MTTFRAFYYKEWIESLRSMRAIILFIVCLIFGIGSPLLAKLMPEIMRGYKLNGVTISIPTPTAADSFAQFYHNFSQMGLIVLMLIFAGLLCQELTRGTLLLPLAKGLSRPAIVLAKYSYALSLWTVCFAVSAAAQCGYTVYLFHHLPMRHLLLSFFCFWLFGALLPALLLLFGAWFKSSLAALGLSAAVIALFFIGQSFLHWLRWNPIGLAGNASDILQGQMRWAAVETNSLSVLLSLAAALIGASLLFSRKQL